MKDLQYLLALKNIKGIGDAFARRLLGDENIVFQHLNRSKLHIDQIAYKTNIDLTKLFSLLLSMEMKGIIKSFPGNYYKVVY